MSDGLQPVATGEGRPRRPFVDAVLAGDELPWAIDSWIARWHEEGGHGVELHDWLGLTWEEYSVLGRGDDALGAVLYARKRQVTLDEALTWFARDVPVAARGSGNPHALYRILVDEGLVEEGVVDD